MREGRRESTFGNDPALAKDETNLGPLPRNLRSCEATS